MSCYDSVTFCCPKCNGSFTEQTKAGKCCLRDYDSKLVPLRIAAALNGERVFCPHCETEFAMIACAPTRVEVHLDQVGEDSDDD